MSKKKLNNNHPEAKEGEIFLTNVWMNSRNEDYFSVLEGGYHEIGWTSKRLGSVAYDIYDKPVSGMRPVFVQRSELQKAGLNPDKLFSALDTTSDVDNQTDTVNTTEGVPPKN